MASQYKQCRNNPMIMMICDRICEKGLSHSVINIEKAHFEILNTVYLKNAWYITRLQNSPSIYT